MRDFSPEMVRPALFAGLLAVTLAAAVFEWSRPLELKLLDVQFRALRAWGPAPVSRDIVVIGVDEATVAAFPECRRTCSALP